MDRNNAYSSIRSLVESFDAERKRETPGGLEANDMLRLRAFAELYRIEADYDVSFSAKERIHLSFVRWLVSTGRLVESPANYWRRWEPRRDSLGSEWGSPIF